MKNPSKIVLLLASLVTLGSLAGCGSDEAEVDKAALDARNSQRAGAPAGGPPASTTAGAPAATTGQ